MKDENGNNKYYISRDQLDQIYPIISKHYTGTYIPVDESGDENRYMTDFEMIEELDSMMRKDENEDDDILRIHLLKEIIQQRLVIKQIKKKKADIKPML